MNFALSTRWNAGRNLLTLALFLLSLACNATTPSEPKVADKSLQRKLELIKRLDAVVIPELNFRQAPLSDVVQFLCDATVSCCPAQTDGINILLMDTAASKTPITLSLRKVPLMQTLKMVATLAGLEVYVDEQAILLRKPKKEAPSADKKSP